MRTSGPGILHTGADYHDEKRRGEAFISSEYTVNARADSIIMRLGSPIRWPRSWVSILQRRKRFLQIGDAILVAPQKTNTLYVTRE